MNCRDYYDYALHRHWTVFIIMFRVWKHLAEIRKRLLMMLDTEKSQHTGLKLMWGDEIQSSCHLGCLGLAASVSTVCFMAICSNYKDISLYHNISRQSIQLDQNVWVVDRVKQGSEIRSLALRTIGERIQFVPRSIQSFSSEYVVKTRVWMRRVWY